MSYNRRVTLREIKTEMHNEFKGKKMCFKNTGLNKYFINGKSNKVSFLSRQFLLNKDKQWNSDSKSLGIVNYEPNILIN